MDSFSFKFVEIIGGKKLHKPSRPNQTWKTKICQNLMYSPFFRIKKMTHRLSDWSRNAAARFRRPVSGPWAVLPCGVRIWGTAQTFAIAVCPFAGEFLENKKKKKNSKILFPINFVANTTDDDACKFYTLR